MIKAIFLDMDDTLIVNQVLYEEAHARLFGYLRHFGVKPAEAYKVFADIDKENFKTLGYSRERMPSSFEKTLKYFVPHADQHMIDIARSFAEEIFETVARVKPGVPEAIALLAEHYAVYIITAGDKGVQEFRLANLPFKDQLAGAFVVDRKDKQTFTEVTTALGLKPEEAVMMGDSLKSDIIPSVAAGLHAVWIEAHNSPLHEAAKDFPADRAYRFASLLEVARHIVKYGSPAAPIKLPPPTKPTAPKM